MLPDDFTKPKVSEVVSITSHQLKTPISIVKAYLEALLSEDYGKINDKQKEYLGDALENIKRMSMLVNHLLDVSRIEERRYELQSQEFSLKEVTEDIIRDFFSWAQASNCQIILKTEKKLPLTISDPLKIRQVIENIIANAIKYKSPGQGKIEISIKKENNMLLFSCQDNGIGIPEDDFSKVFSKFYRAEKAVEIDPSGTGLGLYIDKAIIELSGGKIWYEKNPDAGVTFYFTLPIAI